MSTLKRLGLGLVGTVVLGSMVAPAASTIVLGMHYHTMASGWALGGTTIAFSGLLMVALIAKFQLARKMEKYGIMYTNGAPGKLTAQDKAAKGLLIIAALGFGACLTAGGAFGLMEPAIFSQTLSGMLLASTNHMPHVMLTAKEIGGMDAALAAVAALIIIIGAAFLMRKARAAKYSAVLAGDPVDTTTTTYTIPPSAPIQTNNPHASATYGQPIIQTGYMLNHSGTIPTTATPPFTGGVGGSNFGGGGMIFGGGVVEQTQPQINIDPTLTSTGTTFTVGTMQPVYLSTDL